MKHLFFNRAFLFSLFSREKNNNFFLCLYDCQGIASKFNQPRKKKKRKREKGEESFHKSETLKIKEGRKLFRHTSSVSFCCCCCCWWWSCSFFLNACIFVLPAKSEDWGREDVRKQREQRPESKLQEGLQVWP